MKTFTRITGCVAGSLFLILSMGVPGSNLENRLQLAVLEAQSYIEACKGKSIDERKDFAKTADFQVLLSRSSELVDAYCPESDEIEYYKKCDLASQTLVILTRIGNSGRVNS